MIRSLLIFMAILFASPFALGDTATIADTTSTFKMTVWIDGDSASLSVPLSSFDRYPLTGESVDYYTYELDDYSFHIQLDTVATLNDLEITLQIVEPYTIDVAYELVVAESNEDDYIYVEVDTTHFEITAGDYKGRARNSNGYFENTGDSDGYVCMRADKWGDIRDATSEFETNLGTFQRTWSWLDCDADGCYATVYLSYPSISGWVNFADEVDEFWIENNWEGTTGDRFTHYNRFFVAPQ